MDEKKGRTLVRIYEDYHKTEIDTAPMSYEQRLKIIGIIKILEVALIKATGDVEEITYNNK